MPRTDLHPQALITRGKWNDFRDEIWGNSFSWSWVRPWDQLKYIVIHHTVTKHDATPQDIALLHKARGWAGIGYHFVITKDGTVYYVGDISTARAHVLNKNEQALGITMVGDFTKHLPSDDQIRSAHDLVKFLLTETPSIPSLSSWEQLVGHKDLQATACPGTSWPDDMRQRIIERRVYTAEEQPKPEPQPEPKPIIVVTNENTVIRIGNISGQEYGDMRLVDIRTGIEKNAKELKEALEENKKLEEENGKALEILSQIREGMTKLLEEDFV